jgi:hypothetical protein
MKEKKKQHPKLNGLKDLDKFLKNMPLNKVVLFLVDPKKYMDINLQIIKIAIKNNKFSGIYITINRPFSTLVNIMEKHDIDTDKIFFIDCITKMVPSPKGISLTQGKKFEKKENCIFIPSPSRLTEIGLALSEALSGMKNPSNKFLYLDSLSTLSIYNDLSTIAKFVHFLTTRIRLFGVVGLIMCVEKKMDDKLFNILSEVCDMTIEVV